MPDMTFRLELRPSTLDDAEMVADLQARRDPDDLSDAVLLRYWWQMADELHKTARQIATQDGEAVAFVAAQHEEWDPDGKRFGVVRALLRNDLWDDGWYSELVGVGERWLRGEGATTSVVRIRADFERDVKTLERIGYREDRRMRTSELDLVAKREEILRTRDDCRGEMRRQGIEIHPLSEDTDPGRLQKLYDLIIESEQDIPRSVPWRVLSFPEWKRFWLDNPGIQERNFWIARAGDEIVGTSVLDCPVTKGIPWTAYTGTRRSVRGRGIGRALKYESMAQAIEDGYARVRTNNDADNPSILKINNQMGYRLVTPIIELHRALS
jgi:GNAT superfamily N-acetyltransferase